MDAVLFWLIFPAMFLWGIACAMIPQWVFAYVSKLNWGGAYISENSIRALGIFYILIFGVGMVSRLGITRALTENLH